MSTPPLYLEDSIRLRVVNTRYEPLLHGEAICVVVSDLGVTGPLFVWCKFGEGVEPILRGFNEFSARRSVIELAALRMLVAKGLVNEAGAYAKVLARADLAEQDVSSHTPPDPARKDFMTRIHAAEAQVLAWRELGDTAAVRFRPFGRHEGLVYVVDTTASRAVVDGGIAMVRLENGHNVPMERVERV